jgi:hypothetical protein
MSEHKGYQGFNCTCKACQALSDEERAAKQERIRQARRRGGKTRAAQPSMKDARSKGFWTTMERHPFFARGHLRRKIKFQNHARMIRTAFVPRSRRPRRPMPPTMRPPFW